MLIYEKVNLTYGSKVILENVDLQVNEGEFVILVGPSGCGKSSLLNLAAGTLKPTSGRVWFEKNLILGTDPKRGIMFQDPSLFPWLTARENVSFSLKMKGINKKFRYDMASQYLDQVGLSEYAHYRSYELSGGMKQRVALARTLILDPQLILMDEPLGALDAITKRKMQDLFLKIWQQTQKTFFLVTHDVDEAVKLGTRIIVLAPTGGRIIADIDLQKDAVDRAEYIQTIYDLLAQGTGSKS